MIDVLETYAATIKDTEYLAINEENYFEIRKKYMHSLFLLGEIKKNNANKKFEEISRMVLPLLILRCKDIID